MGSRSFRRSATLRSTWRGTRSSNQSHCLHNRWWGAEMRGLLQGLQQVHAPVRDRAGTVVLVAPTVSQEGAAGLVPYATAVEGQRLMAKAAARQWASDGISVLIVAPRVEALVDDPRRLDGTDALRNEPALGP